MSDSSVEAALEICDFLDTLLLEQARSELQDYLDKTDRDDPSANWSRSGRGRRPKA
jgi:hypothetical protein